MIMIAVLATLLFVNGVCAEYAVPPATYEANSFTTWAKERVLDKAGSGAFSRKATIHVSLSEDDSDFVELSRLDLVSDSAYARGYAHGFLLFKEIVEFTGPQLDKFYSQEVLNLDVSQFPDPLKKILSALKVAGAVAAPRIFKEAMAWVWEKEQSYVPQYMVDEMEGIAAGVCAKMDLLNPTTTQEGGSGLPTVPACNVTEWSLKVKQLNMLPELIRMACTAYGAWGKATASSSHPGGLLQLRALDFGNGPFANYSVLQVHRSSAKRNPSMQAFVSLSFPAFVGAVTGISQSGVGISEKVFMTYSTPEQPHGSYNGLADVFVLREILQNSKNRIEAEQYLQTVSRTWAIWIGIGDYQTQRFDLVDYSQKESIAYTDVTAPSLTGQPYLESIAYVDKHPQPSGEGPKGSLPTALTDFYGNITSETSKIIIQSHQTGDVHIASYDYSAKVMYTSIGKTNHAGEYGPADGTDKNVWKAYNRPYLKFNLEDLWNGL